MMPTTRYQRYLFYRNRAKKRIRRIERRKLRMDHGHLQVTTMYVTDGLQYQAALPEGKLKPRRPAGSVLFNVGAGDTKPDKGVLGVKPDHSIPPVGFNPANHPRGARVGYQHRRVGRIPRLKNLPKFWPMPYPAPGDHSTYPIRYPSGRRNPTAWMTNAGPYFDTMPDGWVGWNGPYIPVGYMTVVGTPNNVPPFFRTELYPSEEWDFWPYTGGG